MANMIGIIKWGFVITISLSLLEFVVSKNSTLTPDQSLGKDGKKSENRDTGTKIGNGNNGAKLGNGFNGTKFGDGLNGTCPALADCPTCLENFCIFFVAFEPMSIYRSVCISSMDVSPPPEFIVHPEYAAISAECDNLPVFNEKWTPGKKIKTEIHGLGLDRDLKFYHFLQSEIHLESDRIPTGLPNPHRAEDEINKDFEIWKKVDEYFAGKGKTVPTGPPIHNVSTTSSHPIVFSNVPTTGTGQPIFTENARNNSTNSTINWNSTELEFWTDERVFLVLSGVFGILCVLALLAIGALCVQEKETLKGWFQSRPLEEEREKIELGIVSHSAPPTSHDETAV